MDVGVAANDNLRRYAESEMDTASVERFLVSCLLGNLLDLQRKV